MSQFQTNNILRIRDLNVTYRGDGKNIWANRGVNLDIEEGVAYGIVGESGSGKSTLANAILQQLPKGSHCRGTLQYQGKNLLTLSPRDWQALRWQEIAVVFQGSMNSLSPVHQVGKQLKDIYKSHGLKEKDRLIKERIQQLFDQFHLPESTYKSYPHELSGGMMQRVMIVASLILKPNLLILDEATTALDVITEHQILKEILSFEKEWSLTRLTISHDISVINSSCQAVIVMYGGHVVEEGPVKEVFQKPHHPYTKLLLDAYPDLSRPERPLSYITGTLPDLSLDLQGCPFASRCPRASAKCQNQMPKMMVRRNRKFACWHPLEVDHD